MQIQNVTREQVVELAQTMPLAKLMRWYEYGLFIQQSPLVSSVEQLDNDEQALQEEFDLWNTASDEDWAKFEQFLTEIE